MKRKLLMVMEKSNLLCENNQRDMKESNKQLYRPFPEIPDASTGIAPLVFYIDKGNGSYLTLHFNTDGKLDDESLKVKSNADERIRNIIDVLERKVVESEFIGIEDSGDGTGDSEELEPFDPSTISIEKRIVSMDTLIRRLEQDTICLNPDFQRNEVWDYDRKCKLIESLLLKIPLPMFYISADEKDKWTVVDGLQRISTIRDFVLGATFMKSHNIKDKGKGFALRGLEFCGDMVNGKNMCELPTIFSNRIMETEFTFTVINPGTPEDVKRNIFKRINTGGKVLSPQEIRNALYGGESSRLLNYLAGLSVFMRATGYSVKSERMEDKELILRFISFLMRDYKNYTKAQNIDDWLCDTMIILNSRSDFSSREMKKLIKENRVVLNEINPLSDKEIETRFTLAMRRAMRLFENHAFRKSLPQDRRSPINKSLFEAWGVLLSGLSDEDFERLVSKKQELLKDYRKYLWNDNFVVAISRDSMSKASVNYRYTVLTDLIIKYIQ